MGGGAASAAGGAEAGCAFDEGRAYEADGDRLNAAVGAF